MDGTSVLTDTRDPLAELEDLCRRWEGHVLLVLAKEAGPMQFAEVARAVTRRAGEWYSGAQLDALLKRMETKGFVQREQGSPRRRRYQLSTIGRQQAATVASLLQSYLADQHDPRQRQVSDHPPRRRQPDVIA